MTTQQISALVDLEYRFVATDTDIRELLRAVQALDLAEAIAAAVELHKARLALRKALQALDEPITNAVIAHDAERGEPPF